MILRRLTEHLKHQHWTAIGIELVIVVLGVFLGMQVSNWNESRRDHDREGAYLSRIAAELDESVLSIQRSNALTRERMALDQLLLDTVVKPELVRAEPGHFIYAMTRGGYTFTPNVHGYTFEEIKSSGDLGIFSDPQLSLDLMAFYADVQQKAQWGYLRSMSQFEYIRRSAGILSAEQLALEPDASSMIRTEDVEATMAAYQRMRAKSNFVEWVAVTLSYRRTDLEYGNEILKAAQDLRDRVRAELGQLPAARDDAAPASNASKDHGK
ncbi:MAG: hypothetical protein IPP82_11000 [Xanthomonadales bacterium]|nr:hypothetical protein [Xanthomonadales bacterium]